jgi:hypothetical protein
LDNQEYTQLSFHFSNLNDLKNAISTELEKEAEGFIRIGYLLKIARDTELFAEDGYSNLYEFAQAEYGLDKSTTSRFMSINDKYSLDGNSLEIDGRFRGFGRTKLAEMLTLPDGIVEEIKPEATREEIRELKREVREETEQENNDAISKTNEKPREDSCAGATNVDFSQTDAILDTSSSVQETNKPKSSCAGATNTIFSQLEADSDTLLQRAVKGIFKKDSFKDKLSKIWKIIKKPYQATTSEEELAESIAFNGYAQGKAAGIFIFFKLPEEGIVCMKGAEGDKEEYSYRDLFVCLCDLFQPSEYKDWKESWEDIYGEEQLPGQMNVNMYPEVIPDSNKEELQEEVEIVEESNTEASIYDDVHEETQVEVVEGIHEVIHENTTEAAVVEQLDSNENKVDHASEAVSDERCTFCGTEETGIASHDGDFILRIKPNGHATIVFDNGEHSERAIFEFRNCPMCGRKLGEEN